ncbi:MAG: glycoside hydrolase family 2 TIM barrel-domain containing protein [Candidatus Pseudobacter hemicellulosilyticus]|uniref:Glycoside hydrolase family 2 TIM barrel-domain containing protein n=1 Tax=Candidatus Pseudobacter hemicellulosilyticus TaxID=3121375 RepID=A0AAJ5WVB6_9BACT|nr:MAG: glycoside hydrolase family 2 TIM barrel-domain containing protein [Pseudobacter sp.]
MLPLSSIRFFCLLLCLGSTYMVCAQNKGLLVPQPKETLPVSNDVLLQPKPAFLKTPQGPRKTAVALRAAGTGEYFLEGWELMPAEKLKASGVQLSSPAYRTSGWYPAIVPGTVLTTLVNQGVYPDPYHGLSNLLIPDTICRQAWWYRSSFRLPAVTAGKHTELVFLGINYKAIVWVNGKKAGEITGAFRRGVFDLSALLKREGLNAVAVQVLPPPNPGIPHEESPAAGMGPNGGMLCADGPTFIASEGWDWMPGIRDRNTGLWQPVLLRFSGVAMLDDPQVITDLPLPDTSNAFLTIHTQVRNNTEQLQQLTIKAGIGQSSIQQQVLLQPGETKKVTFSPERFPALRMPSPRLWWPNGYGEPNLYTLVLEISKAGQLQDRCTTSFGIRELSYELSAAVTEQEDIRIHYQPVNDTGLLFDNSRRKKVIAETSIAWLRRQADTARLQRIPEDAVSPFLVIRVNGVRIFCRGGNWGMDDAMKRVSRERLEPYFRLHREANFNMVRNWTGECTEDIFYQLCDEYGLLVWNDWWMSTEGYNVAPADNALFLDNVRDMVRRFRNHPSIALWCPRNEGYAPVALEDSLAAIAQQEDGTRYYQPNSRYLNLRGSGPWHYQWDAAVYFTGIAGGFNTELGTPSIPTAATMRSMLSPRDQWPISDAWYYHDLHGGQPAYRASMDSLYGPALGLDDFCRKAQLLNYDSHRAMLESWNSRLWNNASGVLLWMSHPAWPSTVWQTYSADYETFGSYYACKKACEPVHVQMTMPDNRVQVVNNRLQTISGAQVRYELFDLSGKRIQVQEWAGAIPAASLMETFTGPPLPDAAAVYLCRLSLTDNNGKLLSRNDYWKTGRQAGNFQAFNSSSTSLEVSQVRRTGAHTLAIRLSNPGAVTAIAIKVNVINAGTGAVSLPTWCTAGYFNLLPGETQELELDYPPGTVQPALIAEGYNVKQQYLVNDITKNAF